jgi:hypothetical protein
VLNLKYGFAYRIENNSSPVGMLWMTKSLGKKLRLFEYIYRIFVSAGDISHTWTATFRHLRKSLLISSMV